jgi:hypothetical protein
LINHAQDTALFKTFGILIHQYDKKRISNDFLHLKHRLSGKEKNNTNLGNDVIRVDDLLFLNGTSHLTKDNLQHKNGDSLFIWYSSNYWQLVYLLEKRINIKFSVFYEVPCVNVPYIAIQGFPKVAYKLYSVNCTFIEVTLLVDNSDFCNRLNSTTDFIKFSVGKTYKIFVLYNIGMISSYLNSVGYDKSIEILQIPVLR